MSVQPEHRRGAGRHRQKQMDAAFKGVFYGKPPELRATATVDSRNFRPMALLQRWSELSRDSRRARSYLPPPTSDVEGNFYDISLCSAVPRRRRRPPSRFGRTGCRAASGRSYDFVRRAAGRVEKERSGLSHAMRRRLQEPVKCQVTSWLVNSNKSGIFVLKFCKSKCRLRFWCQTLLHLVVGVFAFPNLKRGVPHPPSRVSEGREAERTEQSGLAWGTRGRCLRHPSSRTRSTSRSTRSSSSGGAGAFAARLRRRPYPPPFHASPFSPCS